ncbi:MAG: acyl-CoA thioesterase [Candidatus Dormibacteraceae bacterium]
MQKGRWLGQSKGVARVDPIRYVERWRVRTYELDSQGHVNNAIYLSWAEEIASRHAEAAGYGRLWSQSRGGAWVIHRADVTYLRPALYGDEIEVAVQVELVKGARGVRRTWIRRLPDRELLAEVLVEWVWVGLDGRPRRVPRELVELARGATATPTESGPAAVGAQESDLTAAAEG